MAKWGEGDPRWIVEERPDATNVNNWHWTEKNATPWSKERLAQLLKGLKIEKEGIECVVDKIDDCSGEATVNNRKGKLIFFYEWKLVLKWTGKLLKNSKLEHKGKITIPNLSEENDIGDIEITITIDESNDESENLKQFMYNIGRDVIRKQLELYIKELKEEYSKNLILPKKGEENTTITPKAKQPGSSISAENNLLNNVNSVKSSDNTNNVGCKLDVKTLKITEEFNCCANDLYNALTKEEMLTAFTRAPAKSDASRGGEFVLYGGNVRGKFEELVPEKRIIQSWRLKNWPSGHYSEVVIDLEEAKNTTQMKLKQTGIPASEFDAMRANWHRYYWQSIKQTFGFGLSISDIW
ncbi:PREDICTED: activator of 90 kDa heat shock protein ATPase homolog 1 [Rhagoletis zephyria]|uniref:activator of 90 kDa heat shock protein ATPase homolog 1 n=1 Tax=Rhagoletis zephyria TaxID=28612 RepID=UPI0008115A77|nr:PREDICTED: activator of 90 kDa heat shock protein ATPase homolog 1 [Rhagoletis zephyria]